MLSLFLVVSLALAAQARLRSRAAFTLSNGQAAQALNAQFSTLTASSACQTGDMGCIAGGFAQCVGGKFVSSGCSGGTQCFALPLVNKAGTSIACTTEADATARIAATGATGGLTGNGAAAAASSNSTSSAKQAASTVDDSEDDASTDDTADANSGSCGAPAVSSNNATVASASASAVANSTETAAAVKKAASTAAAASTGDFKKQNGLDAQQLNAQFATLTAGDPCDDGENACIGDQFAQCVAGKFVASPCSGGLQCFALPLVNKPGTSVTCDTAADAAARITASGASGGVQG